MQNFQDTFETHKPSFKVGSHLEIRRDKESKRRSEISDKKGLRLNS